MINQEFKAQEQRIKCCLILGSVAGSQGQSKLQVFVHVCPVSALLPLYYSLGCIFNLNKYLALIVTRRLEIDSLIM